MIITLEGYLERFMNPLDVLALYVKEATLIKSKFKVIIDPFTKEETHYYKIKAEV